MTFLQANVQINHRVIFFLLMLMAGPALGLAQQLELSASQKSKSTDGHVQLKWQGDQLSRESIFEVQQAKDENFRTAKSIYQGPDRATFVSGLENGQYYFRVRPQGGEWSNVYALQVQHHSLQLTFILLGLGAVVFLCTAAIVIRGARKPAQIQ